MKIKNICLFVALSLVFACTKKEENAPTPNGSESSAEQFFGTTAPKHGKDEIWINNREEPQYMDPILAAGVPDGNLAMNAFARLVQINPETSQPVPDLAERWDVLDEGYRYIFHLREGLKWSDGQPLTAHDFEYSWKRLMNPKTGAQYTALGYTIVEGGEAFGRRAVVISGFSKEAAIDTVQKTLEAKGVSIEKIKPKFQSTDLFVFVNGEGKDADDQRTKLINAITKSNALGQGISAKMADESVVELRALDDRQLEVRLVGPLPYFILLSEFTCFAAVPKHVIERIAKENNGDESSWVRLENIVVSGAYKLVKENFKIDKVYEKNPFYWDAANVKTPRIRVLMIETETAAMNAYKVGEIDWTGPHEVPAEQLNQVQNFKDFHNDPYLGVYYYIINHDLPVLNDVRVRKALSLSIDRETITKNVLAGSYIPYGGLVPDGLAGYKSYQQELYNPEKAKQLLAEAGYPEGKGFPKFKFKYDTKDIHRLIIQAVQQMWKKNLNIDVDMVNVEWKVYLDDLQKHNFEIARQGWIGDFLDPYTFIELNLSNSGNNHSNWKNAEFDALVEKSNQESDLSLRMQMLHDAEKIAMEDQAMIPIYLYTKTYMLKPFIKGFYKDYQDHHLWKHMWVEEK
ncbi:MAG: peptide ABC transporter substrate-binding protein [Bdellovibrionales bacterium]|nr:peptide ABC transporter substrate-binding protein [Bdellovibrionales bacterium]